MVTRIAKVAPVPRPVLVLGERGTGKELVAKALHDASSRPGPFVAVNCACFSDELLEAELFGHERGSFTGAHKASVGKFELAHHGTLFLDEIGHMSLPFQRKILRTVEYGTFLRVGGQAERRVDVRVVAATNADLRARIREGTFLPDLYDRLAFEVIDVPPLRQRPGDVELLAAHFFERFMREVPAFHGKVLTEDAPPAAPGVNAGAEARLRALLEFPLEEVRQLKRCTKCLLPETFPYIRFDGQGVCNYCANYRPKGLMEDRREKLEEVLKQYRREDGKPDCVVAFSGGRDSSYGLHLLVKEFGMHPLTFTYDWGMVTDLARRNIARMTGKLGIENILVSADIKQKRRNIRLNVEAWLRRPRLGMIPLFMAGDKHFFVHVNNIRRQTGIHCDIWMENKLENTDFKAGFAGIRPNFEKERIDKQSTLAKLQMPLYYARNFLVNPAYINPSIPDTYSAFKAYYMEPREVYLLLFDFVPWNEEEIGRTLIGEYNWELAPDTDSTWRIGDGTAAFYNYIYYTVAGFTEFDTFRSNQVREGMIGRDEALKAVDEENRPRFESMKWYFDTIGVDMERAVNVINAMPRLYRQRGR